MKRIITKQMRLARRAPKSKRVPATKTVRLIDGPHDGEAFTLPRSKEAVRLGPWLYKYCGKQDGHEVFAKWPRSRPRQRALLSFIANNGKHPSVLIGKGTTVRNPVPKSVARPAKRALKKAGKKGTVLFDVALV